MAETGYTRRGFLVTLGSAVAGLALLRRFLVPRRQAAEKVLRLPRQEVPPEGALVYRASRVAIVREEQDLYALDLVCSHLGCTVSVTPTGLVCPCHGSRFDRGGAVLEGPATRPLKRYPVRVEEDAIVVLTG